MKKSNLICTLAFAIALMPATGIAHGDEDHSDDQQPAAVEKSVAPPKVGSEEPTRQPDGSIFMPKASQNLLGIRTIPARLGNVNEALALKGHVRPDPSAGGQVQATQTGRIMAAKAGLPALGQSVKKGQVLAWLEPVVGSVERSNQQAQLAQIRSQLSQAERRAARYAQLEGSVPQKEIDAARSELQALKQQQAALSGGLGNRLPLTAPVSGVISKVNVVAGEVVDAKQAIFDIVDPQRLIVEALGYDPRLIGNIDKVSGSTEAGGKLDLALLGTGLELREQALQIHLRIKPPLPALAVGQPVNVFAQLKNAQPGVVVPNSAVSKDASGEQMVWVHTTAERFTPKKVQARNLSADSAVVTKGLAGGERVVIQGVSSLAQVR